MSRSIAPDEICLLALIELFCCGAVSEKDSTLVLSFITARISPSGAAQQPLATKSANEEIPYTLNFEHLSAILSRADCPPSTISTSSTAKESVWDSFVAQICGIDSFDALAEFFRHLNKLFDGGAVLIPISKMSLLGAFVRSKLLKFEFLGFSDQMMLWHDYGLYCQKIAIISGQRPRTEDSLQKFDELSGGRLMEVVNNSLGSNLTASILSGPDTTTRLLEFQAERMQKFGARLPAELKEKLHIYEIMPGVSTPLIHYVRFLDAWYAGDYPSSFESLHRYNDYALQHKDRSHYQWALLNMAVLHADFGCLREAIAAIAEAIAAARESKDMVCLTYCLSWLYHFQMSNVDESMKDFGQSILGSDFSALRYLISEARKYELWSVESSAKLSEAALCLAKGHRPREAFERIYETAYLTVHYNVHGTVAAQMLLQSSTFGRLGTGRISQAYCDLVPQLYGPATTEEDNLRAVCRRAHILSAAGEYSRAFEVLQNVEHKRPEPLKIRQYLIEYTRLLKLQHALHGNDLFAAESLLYALLPITTSASSSATSRDIFFQIHQLHIKYLICRSELSEAFALVEKLLSGNTESPSALDVHHRIAVLCAKARIFIKAGRPQKGFSITMRACKGALRSRNLAMLWESVGVLGAVLCGMESYAAARECVGAVYWQAKETNDAELCAGLATTLAEACVGEASLHEEDPTLLHERLREGLEWAERAHADYTRLGDVLGIQDMDQKQKLLNKALSMQPV